MSSQRKTSKPVTGEQQGVGRWWIDDSGRYLRHSLIDQDRKARRRAFDHLRMVEVIVDPHAIRLRWDVSQAAISAMIAAAHLLAISKPDTQVHLEFFWGAWNREFKYTTASAIARIAETAHFRTITPFKGTKRVVCPVSTIMHEDGILAHGFRMWERDGARFSTADVDKFATLAPYALVLRQDPQKDALVFQHIGIASGAARIFGSSWAKSALGRRCDRSQPDFEFEDRVCSPFLSVIEDGEPIVDHVRAVIRRPGHDPVWVPYQRLLIPARDRFGAPLVISLCDVRQDVSIAFMAA
ncbi:MAG: hypothetical protein WD075_08275 [Rhodospirillales bacterium]